MYICFFRDLKAAKMSYIRFLEFIKLKICKIAENVCETKKADNFAFKLISRISFLGIFLLKC